MNAEFELKLQAYLDGEMNERQAREMEARIKSTPQAGNLLAELRTTAGALRGNEPEYTVPETRDFYWSKIERAIMTADRPSPAARSSSWFGWLFRYWPQLSGATVAALLLTVGLLRFGGIPGPREDIENPLDDTGTFTYRSEQQRMTLVWVSTTPQDQDEDIDNFN
jgi:anti-sigma factor RsiW